MRRAALISIALTIVSLLPLSASAAEGPSFDCRKAQGEVQALICKDPDLAALDRKLDEVFRAASSKAKKDRKALRAEQDGWLRTRDDCSKQPDAMQACVGRGYQSRIGELQALYELVPSKGPYTFACANRADPIVVKYFHTDPPSARLQRGGETVVAWAEPGAKGTKFVAPNVSFLNKGMTAQVEWRNDKFTCEVQPTPGGD
jgi:uncharacterized protein